jgi:hypothetical protein
VNVAVESKLPDGVKVPDWVNRDDDE